jgi:hypothetical protein
MKELKYITIVIMVGLALLAQLMSVTLAYADRAATPKPSTPPAAPITPPPTEVPTQIRMIDSTTPKAPSGTLTQSETNPAEPTQKNMRSTTRTAMPTGTATAIPQSDTATSVSSPTAASVRKSTFTPEPPTMTVESALGSTASVETTVPTKAVPDDTPILLEIQNQISDKTDLVVLNESGQPEPLVTQNAADIITQGDPIWCPNGVAPGGAGCTPYYLSLTDLLTFSGNYINSQNVDGTIWITSNVQTFDTTPVIIDGSTHQNWATHTLTLQGGWNGIFGSTGITNTNSIYEVPIQILNWNADVTINNITVQNASGSGLGVHTNGSNIEINNSRFINNHAGFGNFPWGDGADLFPNGGHITITNSEFSGNNWDGLYIVESSQISIHDSNLNSNGTSGYGGGLNVFNPNSTTAIDIDNSAFDLNQSYDILAYCNTGNTLNVSLTDFLRLNIFLNNNCMVTASVATPATPTPVRPTPTITSTPPGPTLSPTSTPTGTLPVPTPTNTPGIAPTQTSTFVPGTLVLSNGTAPPGKSRSRSPGSMPNRLARSHAEIYLECARQPSFTVPLPNGDKVEIICPSDTWSGKATISRLDNTSLPGELPSGYTYASAFQVNIDKLSDPIEVIGGQFKREPIGIIPNPGYIKASFVALPSQRFGGTYSILFWDNGTWVPLKDLILAANRSPQVFYLHPDQPEDDLKIISGVDFIDNPLDPRVEVSTNFPGIFVLVQH